jgi:L-asparaginase
MKKIYVIYTGGTMGMVPGPYGYEPKPGYLAHRLALILQNHPLKMHMTFNEYPILIDSSDLMPGDWNRIAQDIADNYALYDGFVVLHGTDTAAYTASALSFMLENLAKPVILVGAQISLYERSSDGEKNILDGLFYACQDSLAGVYITFGGRLLQGNRTRKVDADRFTAFISPNFAALVDETVGLTWQAPASPPLPALPFFYQSIKPDLRIVSCKLVPGYTYTLLTQLLAHPLQGLVLESYGTGNGPQSQHDFLAALQKAHHQGCHIINVSQCLYGKVSHTYAAGQVLEAAGAICGGDITLEAALTKLYYILSKTSDPIEQKTLLQKNLRNEVT